MPSSKVSKILGVSPETINPSSIHMNDYQFSRQQYDRPPVLPMPTSMSPINKNFTSFSSSSSLDLDLKSSSQKLQRSSPPVSFSTGRRNALDPSLNLSISPKSKPIEMFDFTGSKRGHGSRLDLQTSKSTACLRENDAMEHLNNQEMLNSSFEKIKKRHPFEYAEENRLTQDSIDSAYEPLLEKSPKSVVNNNNKQRQRSESFANHARQNDIILSSPNKANVYPTTPEYYQQSFKTDSFSPSSTVSSKRSDNQRWTSSSVGSSGKWSDNTHDTTFSSTSMKTGLASPVSLHSLHGMKGDNVGIQSSSNLVPSEASIRSAKSSLERNSAVYTHHQQSSVTSPPVSLTQKYAQVQSTDSSSRRTRLVDVKEFPLMRREAVRHCLMDENVIKIENVTRKGLMRKKVETNERNVVLTTNSRQIFEPLSAKLANLTGASTIGQAKFSFNDCSNSETFVFLHCFKSCSSLTKEEERLMLTSDSFVAVAESSSSFNIDRQTWALKVAGYINSSNTPKSRAAEQEQVQWTLQFDTKHRLLKWQTILRALIIALNEADQVFRIGPPIKPVSPHISISSISTNASSVMVGGMQTYSPIQETFSVYDKTYKKRELDSHNRGDSVSREDEAKERAFVASLSSLSLNSSRTSRVYTENNSRISVRSNDEVQIEPVIAARISSAPKIASKNDEQEIGQANERESKKQVNDVPIKATLIVTSKNMTTSPRKRSTSVDSSESGMKGFNLAMNEFISTPNLQQMKEERNVLNKVNKISAFPPPPPPPPPKYPPPAVPLPPLPFEVANEESKEEDGFTRNLRQIRSEIALAMASAASPRSISSISSFTGFSEDISGSSSVYSLNTDVEEEQGSESHKEANKNVQHQPTNKVKSLQNNKPLSTSAKQELNDIDAIYAMIDASYNISAYTSSFTRNIIIRNPERMKRISHEDVPLGFASFSKESRKSVISISSNPLSPSVMSFDFASPINNNNAMYPVDEQDVEEESGEAIQMRQQEKLLAARQKAKTIRNSKSFINNKQQSDQKLNGQEMTQTKSLSNNSLPIPIRNEKRPNRNDPAIGMAI